jgi:hypothetical protein
MALYLNIGGGSLLSWNQGAPVIAPWLLLAISYLTYQLLDRLYGKKISYLEGFLLNWIVQCALFPLTIPGSKLLSTCFLTMDRHLDNHGG